MLRFLFWRLLGAAVLILAVSVLAFALVRFLPGGPAQAALGLRASPAEVERLNAALGLDRPVAVQYAEWLGRALRLDFGTSLSGGARAGTPVADLIARGLAVTVPLALLGTAIAVAVGLPLGLAAAARAGRGTDRAVSAAAVVALSLPPFYLGYLLILVFAVRLGWLPSVGYVSPAADPAGFLRIILLPALTIGIINAAPVARTARAAAVEVAAGEPVRLARLAGAPPGVVWFKHVLRGAMVPVVTVVGLQVGFLMGGVIVVENMFALPGLGRQMLIAAEQRDYPTLQAVIVVFAAAFVLVNLVVDLLYAAIDPRIRPEGG